MAAPAGTLERVTEVTVPKSAEVTVEPVKASVAGAAASEQKASVPGSGIREESRAWNSRAQVD